MNAGFFTRELRLCDGAPRSVMPSGIANVIELIAVALLWVAVVGTGEDTLLPPPPQAARRDALTSAAVRIRPPVILFFMAFDLP
jgi:hypothetical protein